MNKREIEREIVEAQTLTCQSCPTIVEVPDYCPSCQAYWDDVRNGMFERDEFEALRASLAERSTT